MEKNVLTEGTSKRTLNDARYYDYNNKIYKLTESGVTEATAAEKIDLEKVMVKYGAQSIMFKIDENKTWYDWATDESDTNDIDLSSIKSGLTLKGLIKQVNGETNNRIKYTKAPTTYGLEEDKEFYFAVDSSSGNGAEIKTSEVIVNGNTYNFHITARSQNFTY